MLNFIQSPIKKSKRFMQLIISGQLFSFDPKLIKIKEQHSLPSARPKPRRSPKASWVDKCLASGQWQNFKRPSREIEKPKRQNALDRIDCWNQQIHKRQKISTKIWFIKWYTKLSLVPLFMQETNWKKPNSFTPNGWSNKSEFCFYMSKFCKRVA